MGGRRQSWVGIIRISYSSLPGSDTEPPCKRYKSAAHPRNSGGGRWKVTATHPFLIAKRHNHNHLWFIVLNPFSSGRLHFFSLISVEVHRRWVISRTCTTSGWSRGYWDLWSKTTFRKSSGTLFRAHTSFPTWLRLSRLFGFSPRHFRRNAVPTWSRTGPPPSTSGSSVCWFS